MIPDILINIIVTDLKSISVDETGNIQNRSLLSKLFGKIMGTEISIALEAHKNDYSQAIILALTPEQREILIRNLNFIESQSVIVPKEVFRAINAVENQLKAEEWAQMKEEIEANRAQYGFEIDEPITAESTHRSIFRSLNWNRDKVWDTLIEKYPRQIELRQAVHWRKRFDAELEAGDPVTRPISLVDAHLDNLTFTLDGQQYIVFSPSNAQGPTAEVRYRNFMNFFVGRTDRGVNLMPIDEIYDRRAQFLNYVHLMNEQAKITDGSLPSTKYQDPATEMEILHVNNLTERMELKTEQEFRDLVRTFRECEREIRLGGDGPTLVHCRQGSQRTAFALVVLQLVAGKNWNNIVENGHYLSDEAIIEKIFTLLKTIKETPRLESNFTNRVPSNILFGQLVHPFLSML